MEQERSNFNPCVFQRLIYLPGGIAATHIEIFSPQENRFIQKPTFRLPERKATLSWIEDGVLIVVSRNYVTTFDLTNKDAVPKYENNKDTEFYSKSHPVIARGYAYFVDHDDRIFRVQKVPNGVIFSKIT